MCLWLGRMDLNCSVFKYLCTRTNAVQKLDLERDRDESKKRKVFFIKKKVE